MSNTTPLYSLRQRVQIKVTGQRGFIVETHTADLNTPRYRVLHLDHNDGRAQTWLPETEIEPLPQSATMPFPDPFSTPSSSS
jgi:hypothetical protein